MSEKKAPYHEQPPKEAKALTPKEKKLLESLRSKNKGNPCDAKTADDTVIRFIRGYSREKDPIVETHKRYSDMLKWRLESNIDDVILNPPKNWEQYNKIYKAFIYGRDRIGRPVCYEQLGKLEPQELLDFGIPACVAGHIRFMEELTKVKWQITRDTGKLIYKHVHVIDLEGFGWKHTGSQFRSTIKKIMSIDSDFYPETLQKLFVLNASWIFRTLWAIVSPWIHPLTKARITLLGFNKEQNLKAMMEYIDIDQIPEYLGGKNKAPMQGICLYPFKDIDRKSTPNKWAEDSQDPRAVWLRKNPGAPSGSAPVAPGGAAPSAPGGAAPAAPGGAAPAPPGGKKP